MCIASQQCYSVLNNEHLMLFRLFIYLSHCSCWNYFNLLLLHNSLLSEIEGDLVLVINGSEIFYICFTLYCLELSTLWFMWLKYYNFFICFTTVFRLSKTFQCFNCVLDCKTVVWLGSDLFSSILCLAWLQYKTSMSSIKTHFEVGWW